MMGKGRAWARNPISLRALYVQTRCARASWLFHLSRTTWTQDVEGDSWHRVERHAIQVYPSLPRHPLLDNTLES